MLVAVGVSLTCFQSGVQVEMESKTKVGTLKQRDDSTVKTEMQWMINGDANVYRNRNKEVIADDIGRSNT